METLQKLSACQPLGALFVNEWVWLSPATVFTCRYENYFTNASNFGDRVTTIPISIN
jgi:hypothetical protein